MRVGDTLAYYDKYTIRLGDTLQMIAFQKLGSTDDWYSLASLNNLKYPYIVGTNRDKMENPLHLVAPGDSIKLPTSTDSLDSIKDDTLTSYEKDSVYDTTLGMDLRLTHQQGRNLNEEVSFLTPSASKRDVALVSGIENLRQSIEMRLLTRHGTYLNHPNYGTYLYDYLGKNVNKSSLQEITTEVLRTITTDNRVKTATITNASIDGGSLYIAVKIEALDFDEALTLFLTKVSGGDLEVL